MDPLQLVLMGLATPQGQVLASAAVSAVINTVNGSSTPDQAAADFADACSSYANAVKAWKAAEAANLGPGKIDAP